MFVRLRLKLISFRFDKESLNQVLTFAQLREEVGLGMPLTADDLRVSGIPIATVLIQRGISEGRVDEILEKSFIVDPSYLGIIFREVSEGGAPFELAETLFTIGQMKRLLELKEAEVKKIYRNTNVPVNEVIRKSEKVVADNVHFDNINNCPLVDVTQIEAQEIAALLGCDLPTAMQWERVASSVRGWGDFNLLKNRIGFKDQGTRPTKLKPADMSSDGIYDLISLVSEWTSSWHDTDPDRRVYRGGSWKGIFEVQVEKGLFFFMYPGVRVSRVGFRLARPVNNTP